VPASGPHGTRALLHTPSGQQVPLEVADTAKARARGLLGRNGIDGALLLTPARSVHTFRMRFAIDVAYLDAHFTVLDVHTMQPNRIGAPRWSARHVLEAEAGAMRAWSVRTGQHLVSARAELG